MNQQHVTPLVLLDLSAAFDTIHHDKPIQRLECDCEVTGNALSWFRSYLSDRFQRVSVNGGLSKKFPLCQGVPQDQGKVSQEKTSGYDENFASQTKQQQEQIQSFQQMFTSMQQQQSQIIMKLLERKNNSA